MTIHVTVFAQQWKSERRRARLFPGKLRATGCFELRGVPALERVRRVRRTGATRVVPWIDSEQAVPA